LSWVDNVGQVEHVSEVCDFLVRFDQVDWAVCGGVCGDKMVLSVRTMLPQAEAGEVLRRVVGDLGRAGGHDRRAGGCIPLISTAPSAIDDLQSEIRRRLLRVLDIDDCRGRRLMPLREMLHNLTN
jgi:nanoRNase/pAp phosphatase (c-di-AMP/oligoRNAs hydrolase)